MYEIQFLVQTVSPISFGPNFLVPKAEKHLPEGKEIECARTFLISELFVSEIPPGKEEKCIMLQGQNGVQHVNNSNEAF